MIEMEKSYRKALVDSSAAKVKIDKENLKFQEMQYERYKKLSRQNAVSTEQFQTWENSYRMSQAQLSQDVAQYELNKTVYKMCWLRAQYDAIVNKVFFPYGLPAAELDVMQVSQLSPMGIDVKIDRDIAYSFDASTPVKIYPTDSDEPVTNLKSVVTLTDDGVKIRVLNYQLPPKISKLNGKPIPHLACGAVLKLFSEYTSPVVYGLPQKAVCTDEKGTYVWKGVGVSQEVNEAYASVFPVVKQYVKLGNLVKKIDGFMPFQQVELDNGLKEGDIIVIDPPKDIQEGNEINSSQQRYAFMPGDQVKVVVGGK